MTWMSRLPVLTLLVATSLGASCPCMVRFGVCDETQQSDAVFIGTVESVAPPFLDPFTRSRAMVSLPASEIARLQADTSPDALNQLRDLYLGMFTGMPEATRSRILAARTRLELQNAFEAVQSEGRVAHIRVRTMFKHDSGDDDDKKPAAGKSETPDHLDIWTGSGDCGIDFQVGETYLVYASQDEDSGRLETSVCMRTSRLSAEKGDLAYLYFLQNGEKESARLEGFVSTSFGDQTLPRYEDRVSSPATGSVLELDTGTGLRYTQSDSDGRFSFDGLKAGDYKLSLLEPGFPRAPKVVVTTRSFHADEGSCPRQILILPTRPSTQLGR